MGGNSPLPPIYLILWKKPSSLRRVLCVLNHLTSDSEVLELKQAAQLIGQDSERVVVESEVSEL